MCITPHTLKKHATHNYSTWGSNIVPCGKCHLCTRRRLNEWAFRLHQEIKNSSSASFITLTYDEYELPLSQNGLPTLVKKDFQNFIKRLRKRTHNKIKYYAIGEYGTDFQRPHYHAIMYNLPRNWLEQTNHILSTTWNNGFVHKGSAEMASIKYCLKYMEKGRRLPTTELDDYNPEFTLMSQRLGANYLTPQMVKYHLTNFASYVTLPGGIKAPLPRYFRQKIFNKYQRHLLSLDGDLRREEEQNYWDTKSRPNHDAKIEWIQNEIRKAKRQDFLALHKTSNTPQINLTRNTTALRDKNLPANHSPYQT